MRDSIMYKFIESKGLLDEFIIFKYHWQSKKDKQYYENNKEIILAKNKEWSEQNKEYRKDYYTNNKEKFNTYIPNASKEIKRKRNEEIIKMRSEGKSLREIAYEKQITHQAVAIILKKHKLGNSHLS